MPLRNFAQAPYVDPQNGQTYRSVKHPGWVGARDRRF
jgi:hypothetical protein